MKKAPNQSMPSMDQGVEGRAPCPRCGTEGIVDFFDLIRGRAELHCPACPTGWALATDAPMAHLQ